MKKVELGNTTEQISCMGLGTMYLGTKVEEQTSFNILDCYTGYGGSFLDTANKYANWVPGFEGGESEQLLGKWMKQRGNRQSLFVASKVGFPYVDIPRSLKKEIILSECEKSLKRLDIETIDLYYAHAYEAETPPEEFMEAFYLLRKAGKIRFAGASNFHAWQLAEANQVAKEQGWEGFSCIQQFHTYLQPALWAGFGNQQILTPEMQEFCSVRKLSIVAYSPLISGAYVRNDVHFPEQFRGQDTDRKLDILRTVAIELGVSNNVVVLAWMMQDRSQIIPLIAGSTVSQIEENLKSLSVTLSTIQLKQLKP
jgi:aryl-alcohol dehydrogenase-like predicted oxidoreductase